MPATQRSARVDRLIWLTPSTVQLDIRCERAFLIRPGQFISLVVGHGPDGRIKRPYSIAGLPRPGVYRLCIRILPNGIGSRFVAGLKPGDSVEFSAPHGEFTYRSLQERQVLWISTGTGIAPFVAMALDPALQTQPPAHLTLFAGFRNPEEIVYRSELESLGIECHWAISQRHGENSRRVTDLIRRIPAQFNWGQTDIYLCGNPAMIEEVRSYLLGALRLSHQQIFAEAFAPPALLVAAA